MRGKAVVRVAVVAAVIACVAAAGPRGIAQEQGINFLVEPAEGSATAPEGGYFLLQAEPGQTVRQSLALRNDSGGTLELHLEAVDAVTGPLGGASYGAPGDAPEATGAWITLGKEVLILRPGRSAIVDFEVAIPAGAGSGEHLAGLSVYVPAQADDSGQAGEGETGASIQVQTRRVIAVQVDLPGPSDPELAITGVVAAARPDGLYLEVGIDNVGHGMTKGEGAITIPEIGFASDFSIDTFVPATSIAYPIRWTDSPEQGVFQTSVEITYDGRVTTWQGEVTVGEAVIEELRDRSVSQIPEPEDESLRILLLVGGCVVLLAIGAGWYLMRRRRRAARRRIDRSARRGASKTPLPPRAPSPLSVAPRARESRVAPRPPPAPQGARRRPPPPPPPPPPPEAHSGSRPR